MTDCSQLLLPAAVTHRLAANVGVLAASPMPSSFWRLLAVVAPANDLELLSVIVLAAVVDAYQDAELDELVELFQADASHAGQVGRGLALGLRVVAPAK